MKLTNDALVDMMIDKKGFFKRLLSDPEKTLETSKIELTPAQMTRLKANLRTIKRRLLAKKATDPTMIFRNAMSGGTPPPPPWK